MKVRKSQIVTALLLGDGGIECLKKRKNSKYGKPYRLSVCCSEVYKDYYNFKKKLLVSCFPDTDFVEYLTRHNNVNGARGYKLCTKKDVKQYYDFLYTDGKKDLKKYLMRVYNPLCMAIWFMDDGGTYNHKNKNRDGKYYWSTPLFFLCTNSFREWEVDYAVSFFKCNGLDCRKTDCDKKNDGSHNHRIDFRASATQDIWRMIRKYVYLVGPEMLYKFRLPLHIYDRNGSRDDIELKTIIETKPQCTRGVNLNELHRFHS